MTMVYPIQMLLAGFTLLLAFPLATSNTTATTSKEEIKCIPCLLPPPPPTPINCPPPPIPPSPPPIPPSPPPMPPSPPPMPPSPPPMPPSPPPPPPSPPPPPPLCPRPWWCRPPPCFVCPPPCPGCPSPSCNVCQIPSSPPPRRPDSKDQPGVMGGAVYSPPNEVNPYFPYSFQNPPLSESTASSIDLGLKLVVSIIFLLLSATFSFF